MKKMGIITKIGILIIVIFIPLFVFGKIYTSFKQEKTVKNDTVSVSYSIYNGNNCNLEEKDFTKGGSLGSPEMGTIIGETRQNVKRESLQRQLQLFQILDIALSSGVMGRLILLGQIKLMLILKKFGLV